MTRRPNNLHEIDFPERWDPEERQAAASIEEENPHWHVDWGVGSHRFHAYPRFSVPRGTWASSPHEGDLIAQMRRIEWNVKAWQEGISRQQSTHQSNHASHQNVPRVNPRAAKPSHFEPPLAARAPNAGAPGANRERS
jgi:hypothetical protein